MSFKDMEQRRKIVIPVGVDPEETLAPPHFDAEATMTARPVVPLSQSQLAVDRSKRAQSATSPAPAWRRSSLLVIVIVAAASIGMAGGLAIGFYQRHQSTVGAQPAPASATNETQPAPAGKTTADARKTTPPVETAKAAEQPSPEAKPEAATPKTPVVNATENDARDNQKEDKRDEVAAPSARERRRDEADDNVDREAKKDKKESREERKERRRQREEENDGVQQINRTVGRQVDRIRDIFEGRP